MLKEIQPVSRMNPLALEELGLPSFQKVEDLDIPQQLIFYLARQPQTPIPFADLVTNITGISGLRGSDNWLGVNISRARRHLDTVESPFQIYTLLSYKMLCVDKRFGEQEQRLIGGMADLVGRVHQDVQPLLARCLTTDQRTTRKSPYNLRIVLSPLELEMLGVLIAKYPEVASHSEFSRKLYGVEDINLDATRIFLLDDINQLKHRANQKIKSLTNSRYIITSAWSIGYKLEFQAEG